MKRERKRGGYRRLCIGFGVLALFGMKAYALTTGLLFVLVLAAHIARIAAEGLRLLKEPTFVFTSLLCVGFAVWAWRLFCRLRRDERA